MNDDRLPPFMYDDGPEDQGAEGLCCYVETHGQVRGLRRFK